MADSLEEKTLKSDLAYDGSFLKVHRDEVLLPDGKTSYREYIRHPGAAMIIPVLPNGKLLMIRQFRYPVRKVFLEFPAGKCDPGEQTSQTAQRELLEETGWRAGKWDFLTTIHPVIGYSDEKIDLYLAREMTQEMRRLDDGEFLELVEIPFAEAFAKLQRGEISDVKTMIGIFWYQQWKPVA